MKRFLSMLLIIVLFFVLVSCKPKFDENKLLQGMYGTWIEADSTISSKRILYIGSDGSFEFGSDDSKKTGTYIIKGLYGPVSAPDNVSLSMTYNEGGKTIHGSYYEYDQTFYYGGTRYETYSSIIKFVKKSN